ncbi:hypothetical protein L798_02580 [Zootermopsis nevadensis]|uniref:Uncharacterized protein n=1 Tax=Zootermopsis nevadensis TaxID=136037 RepID=A0A067QHL9_ZOONE|nr:hypothetical protein L798_02580 [Zootermopsis nevadensis]
MCTVTEKDGLLYKQHTQRQGNRTVPILPTIKMETWQTHFTDILNPTGENRAYPTLPPPITRTYRPISTKDITETVGVLKRNKAAGPDGIFNEHIIVSCPLLIETLKASSTSA